MQTKKIIVLDANILIRAVLGKKVRGIIEQYAFTNQFVTPEICYHDARKYLPPLFEKRNLPVQNALDVLEGLNCLVEAIDANLYGLYEQKAKPNLVLIGHLSERDWKAVCACVKTALAELDN